MSRRILVTGAGGFIARHALAPLASSGADVHAVTPREPPPPAGGIRWHRCDLLDQAARRRLIDESRPETVLHCAWVTDHGRFWHDPANLDWTAATLALAREAGEAGMRRFVGVGTCFEYAADIPDRCKEHETPIRPHTLYGVAKDACRRVLEAFAAGTDLSLSWARLFLLYGPGENPARLVPAVARALVAGRPAPISSGRAVRDFMDARDAGAALAALALSPVDGPVNIASGEAASVREVAQMLARLAGRTDLLEIGALADRDEPARLVADTGRLREEVGFRAIRPLETGLCEALEHWRREGPPGGGAEDRITPPGSAR